jgi:uncharacterized membrane protein YoaK (UPF0700 family)
MIKLERDECFTIQLIPVWLLLAFQAGYINSMGFLACHRFVSHMTGFGTQFGTSLGEGNLWIAIETFLAPLFFVFGAFVSGTLTVTRDLNGKPARYDFVSFIIFFLLLIVFLLGNGGYFGEFGEPLVLHRDFALLSILCFICGAQNACYAVLTLGQIRTTHLTGLSTDFGVELSKVTFNKASRKDKRSIIVNWTRFFTFFAFTFGATISVLLTPRLQYDGFLIPMFSSLVVAFVIFNLVVTRLKEQKMGLKAKLAK